MTKNTIKTLTTNAVEFIAKAINCEATKAELTKQYKDRAEEIEKAFTAYNLAAKAEAEVRKQQKAEAEAEKQKKIAEAEQKAKKQKQSRKQKTAEQKKDSKTTEQKAKEKKQKQTETAQKKEDNKQAIITAFTLNDTELKEDSKKNKFTVFYKLGEDKSRALIEIFYTAKEYHVCAKYNHKDAEYHESWGFKYDTRHTDIKAVKTVYNEVLKSFKAEQKQKAEAKKQKKEEKGGK